MGFIILLKKREAMMRYQLEVVLLSETTFSRGDGVAGLVDVETAHHPDGFPYIPARTLKGLLVEACADVLYSLKPSESSALIKAAEWLFGRPGGDLDAQGRLLLNHAELPSDLRQWGRSQWTAQEILEGLTRVRRQTALDETGKPQNNSLRSIRVLLRELVFTSELNFAQTPEKLYLDLLAVAAKGVKRAGLGRNRGRGRVDCQLMIDEKPYALSDQDLQNLQRAGEA